MREPGPLTRARGHVTRPSSFSPGSSWQEKPEVCKLDVHVIVQEGDVLRLQIPVHVLSLCKVAITSSRALMIFLGWHRHMLPSSATLQGQVTGGETEAHRPARPDDRGLQTGRPT